MQKLPNFDNDQEEAEFWDTHDFTDYLNQSNPIDMIFRDSRPPKEQSPQNSDAKTIDLIVELPDAPEQQ